MSEFNKEQLRIFIHNFFTVLGMFSSYDMLNNSLAYFEAGNNSRGSLEMFFCVVVGITSIWLLWTAIKKGVDEFIALYFPNGFDDFFNQLDQKMKGYTDSDSNESESEDNDK